MLAFQRGDEGAFDALVERYSGQVWALITRFLGPVAVREDLVQEVFLRVLRSRERYRPTARFSTWLYRIVFNLCVHERERRSGSEVSLEASAEEEGHGGFDRADDSVRAPFEEMEQRDLIEAVRAAIAALPDRQRMALVLARYEEMSFAEIAEVLDSSEPAIKSLVHRARENLRVSLAPYLAEETA